MATSTDPFSQVLTAFWAMLEAHEPLAALVKPGNRINRLAGERRHKTRVQAADLSELDLVPVGGDEIDLYHTSTTAKIPFSFEVRIKTQRQELDADLLPLTWQVLRAIAAAGLLNTDHVDLGLGFVKRVNVVALFVTRDDPEQNRGIRGWTAVLGVTVLCLFDRIGDLRDA